MKIRMGKFLGFFSLLLLVAAPPPQDQMRHTLHWIESVFYATYAPTKWKEEQFNWSLAAEISRVEAKIQDGSIRSVKDYHSALLGLFNSTKDYHVGIRFFAKEKASLPFQVKGVNDKFYLAYIDREKLPLTAFPFKEGDEITKFGGQPILDIVRDLEASQSAGNPKTQRALAELALTARQAARGQRVPQGRLVLELKKDGETRALTHELTWTYTPESVAFLNDNTDPLHGIFEGRGDFENPSIASVRRIFDRQMGSIFSAPHENAASENRFAIGAPKSYVPELGTKTFEYDRGFFHTRIFRTAAGKNIGLVRIPSYGAGANESREFQQIVKLLEERTDSLVIDQVRNPGGSVPFLYSLASMLSRQPLAAPYHRIALTPSDIIDAENTLEAVALIRDDTSARASLGETIGGYPVSLALARRLGDYSNFLITEWKAGRRLTNPFFLVGVDRIEPNAQANYTKPILVLVDELDFSGGDFFPAILQDNQRAKIMGTRTAGAGGFVTSVNAPNLFGIESISLTGSIAERVNRNPIENLGVIPDINYQLTVQDLKAGGVDFREAILSALP